MMIMVIIRLWREIWSIEMEGVSTREKTRNVRTKITDITLKNIKSIVSSKMLVLRATTNLF